MTDLKDLPGLKRRDLEQTPVCKVCTKPILAGQVPLFYRVTIERVGLMANAIRRAAGLEMLVGHSGLASILGPDEDLAKVMDKKVVAVHEHCSHDWDETFLLRLYESNGDEK